MPKAQAFFTWHKFEETQLPAPQKKKKKKKEEEGINMHIIFFKTKKKKRKRESIPERRRRRRKGINTWLTKRVVLNWNWKVERLKEWFPATLS